VRILGIDPGTAACGYGIVQVDGQRLTALTYGCWRSAPREPIDLRLRRIHEAVAGLIEEHEPQAVVLEESFVGADARTALSIGQARGAVLVASAAAGVSCAEYAPASVKAGVCGYGLADKEQVQRMVKVILRMREPPAPHHAADALAVAICHALAPPLRSVAGVGR
jgi:crossover junction endodeoxyribonuclease RuvC